jgi:hypothetical protein
LTYINNKYVSFSSIPWIALVAVADKTGGILVYIYLSITIITISFIAGQSVENLMGKFSVDKIAFREFVTLLGRYERYVLVLV